MTLRSPPSSTGTFALRLLGVAALVLSGALLWYLHDLVLLVFLAILFAIVLRALAGAVARVTGLGSGLSFVIASATVTLVIGLFFAVLGTQLQAQLVQLRDQLPELLAPLETWLGIEAIDEWLAERAEALVDETTLMSRLAGLSGTVASFLANIVLVVVAGFYIASQPELYVNGIKLLFPPNLRDHAAETLDVLGSALQRWLVGQVAAMLVVGTLVFVGLWALDIESALALGFLAGILEFIPFLGPILAAAPAIAIALAVDPATALWVALLYLVVEQIEGNLLTPLIQQRAVQLPPAVTMFALLAFALLFGPLGVLLATPLTVVCLVLVKQLWVHDALGEQVSLPGNDEKTGEQPACGQGSAKKEKTP